MMSTVPIHHLRTINGVALHIKRDDVIHEFISGNKLYKLKFNLTKAMDQGFKSVLTFGGAYSNHIAATAGYCHKMGIQCIGMIRGEETRPLNPTLAYAKSLGMHLSYIDRTSYRSKTDATFLKVLDQQFDHPYIIPEGGANIEGIRGAEEILDDRCSAYDVVACAMGTGTTFAGIVKALGPNQRALGIPVHRHSSVFDDVINLDPSLREISINKYAIESDFHFGGYAKWTESLLEFMRENYARFALKTDPIYTAKSLYATTELIKNGAFEKGTRVLFIHTGGLQGIAGFEERHGFKIYPDSTTA